MYSSVAMGAIGVKTGSLAEEIALASVAGFAGVHFDIHELADRIDAEGAAAVRSRFADANVVPAGWGLPTRWSGDVDDWRRLVAEMPRLADAAATVGAHRAATWIWSGSDERSFDENRAFHVERLAPIAAALAERGVSLGLEFLGPKTLRDRFRFPFITSSGEMLALCKDVGPNVGLLLDCWHWYTAHETADDLRALRRDDVVVVHVNDAPAGVPIDEQLDNRRALPGTTGVIDIVTFLSVLAEIGYQGPVMAEPMQCGLDTLPTDEARLQATRSSLRAIFAHAGIVETIEQA
ncbi:MAG: sugar phosphate isomerase/epimerase family protein [Thermomicrobiales bacterium]